MDHPKAAFDSDDSVTFTKDVAMWASFGIFALESLINFRQARLLERQSKHTAKGLWNDGAVLRRKYIQHGKAKVIFQTMACSHYMLLVILFMKMDVAPWLWAIVEYVQTAFLPSFRGEFWKSCLYLLACVFIYLAFNGPNFVFRSVVLKENTLSHFSARWTSTWRLHELAGGNAMPTVLLLVTASILFYEAIGIKFNRFYVPVFMAAQIAFGILYPIVNQPRKKHISLMEPGAINNATHDLASCATLKLENVYISDDPQPRNIEDAVQIFGWPRKRDIAIHRSIIEKCTLDDLKALTAQRLGCWKYSNDIRVFWQAHMITAHAFTMIMLFVQQKVSYSQFNFLAEVYPKVAGMLIFAIGFAPIFWLYFRVQMNAMRRQNVFMADKFAAELGYSSELSAVLSKIPAAASEIQIDWLYSLYHNSAPQISERLEKLEKLRVDEEGTISLPTVVNEKN